MADTRTLAARLFLAAIRGYQLLLSPLLGGACRFWPSCSVYATEAIDRHGALAGSWLAMVRLCRCQPLCRGGVDPVPGSPWRARPRAGDVH